MFTPFRGVIEKQFERSNNKIDKLACQVKVIRGQGNRIKSHKKRYSLGPVGADSHIRPQNGQSMPTRDDVAAV